MENENGHGKGMEKSGNMKNLPKVMDFCDSVMEFCDSVMEFYQFYPQFVLKNWVRYYRTYVIMVIVRNKEIYQSSIKVVP